ncbi:MAG: arginine--tRNA ligase [Bacteroidetes bacterium]|nr:MAG: arginine--tRNA ligase [Bacteroidota bacterium]TAG89317.1 MAG: arginine--tRNA ligase [Bacteroidota bacterium]
MLYIENQLKIEINKAIETLYKIAGEEIILQPTRKEFKGSHTFVTFNLSKKLQKNPELVGTEIGNLLAKNCPDLVAEIGVVKGFLNFTITNKVWLKIFAEAQNNENFGKNQPKNVRVMVEYPSPNTNKPLHLGHLRNIFLGDSVSRILSADGYEVIKANLVNDRGIHICKSMLAYQKFGQNETPESAKIKGDHLIGKYYVEFEKQLRKQLEPLMQKIENKDFSDFSAEHQPKIKALIEQIEKSKDNPKEQKKFNDAKSDLKQLVQNYTPLMREAQEMLQKWEKNDTEIKTLWTKMNGWVYQGFDETYKNLGVSFDKFYYESNTYLLGKDIVEEGLKKNIFYQKEDNSVWIDLVNEKLDHKLVLRGNGTSVYVTQDLGTADLKYEDFKIQKSVYVIGDEQEYHCQVLFKILEKLERPYAKGLYHLSYGMIELPEGRMKSRDGNVIDADDMVEEMKSVAEIKCQEVGHIQDYSQEEKQKLYTQIGLGAVKYFLLKIEPKKKIIFKPEESVDFEGDSCPFIQYNHARTCSIMRKAKELNVDFSAKSYQNYTNLHETEQYLLELLLSFPSQIAEASHTYSPSILAQFSYEIAKNYSKFFTKCSIFQAETEESKNFRIALSSFTQKTLEKSLALLGIEAPQKM